MRAPVGSFGLVATVLSAVAWVGACASVPRGQYGVESLEIEGADELSAGAIKRCLLTIERDTFGIPLGLTQAQCSEPPFDRSAPRITLWSWPWDEWSGLNVAVLELDRERIERFYRARGFYDARVLELRYEPEEAAEPVLRGAPGQCDPWAEECTVQVVIVVEEGDPLRVGSVRVQGLEALDEASAEVVADAELPLSGERFDELDYDEGKAQLAAQLAEVSYAEAKVEGEVVLDHERKLAHVTYRAELGPAYRFGEVRVEGQGELPAAPIVAAAGVEAGSAYRHGALHDVQREVYALGAFTSVEVQRELDPQTRTAHLRVKVTPLPYDAFRVGIGVTSGILQRTGGESTEPVPQWDMHLLLRYERRHVLGTLGKLRIEERPRLIFQAPFPAPQDHEIGNVVSVRLSEPGLVDARTELVSEATWDYGPDPFLGFRRSDVILRLSANRPFLRRELFATLGVQHDRFIVSSDTSTNDGSPVPKSYLYSFVDQELRLDLRDDEVQPRRGAYFSVLVSESVRAPFSHWTLVRVVPDVRAYLPLPFDMVLAGRFALGALFVFEARPALDEVSKELGPTSYRLRGGGAQSNRGFIAGELGDGNEGGQRRWEGSAELRVRLGQSFGVVLFYDVGDVSVEPEFRFDRTNPSAGFGFRYLTIVGALRADLGVRLGPQREEGESQDILGLRGALHFTLGEAF